MASGPAVGGDDGAKEIKVYKRKAIKAPKKNVAKNSTVAATAAETPAAATTENKSNSDSSDRNVTANAKEVSENLQQPKPPEQEEARSQSLSDDHVDSVRKPEEEAQLRTQSAEDVDLETETEQQLQIRADEGPEPEQERQLQTLTAENVDLAIETESQLQARASEHVTSVPELEQECQLSDFTVENVDLAIETEPQLQARGSEDANLVPEPEQELQLQTLTAENVNLAIETEPQLQAQASEDANSVPEPEQELQSQTLAAEDVNLGREPEREPQLQVLPAEDANRALEPGPEQEPQLLIQAAEDVNPVQQQLVSRPDMVVDDSSSLNQQQMPTPSAQEAGNGSVKQGLGRVKLNFGSRLGSKFGSGSKQELRRKLELELDKVRKLVQRIEAKEGEIVSGLTRSHVLANEVVINGANRTHSAVALESVNRETTRPLNHLNVSVLVNGQGVMSDNVEKEKRTPKANPLYRNSEFLLAKDKFPPADSNKKSKLNGKKHGRSELGNGFGMGAKFSKSCSSLLEKLMKHKHGWVFNLPVDAKALLLHDYHIIIKHPMDLGTVKSRLNKNWYKSPKEFAEDVRLTFSNAMTYNPEGQDVHVMAEQLSKIFEDRWAIIESDYNREMRFHQDYESSLPTPTSRYVPLPLPVSLTRPSPLDMRRIIDRSESFSHSFDPKLKPTSTTPSSRTPAPKKPKAKDPNKRDMTYEEKQKLSTNLQSLPSEKLDNIVQIIKKRNSAVLQQDDEIEVDIDRVDAETLWELDRFVTNYKKGLSKNKRKAELAIQARGGAVQNFQGNNPPSFLAAPSKEIRTDNRNDSASSPVQGAREGDNASGSSSSSSSSSDSGSSSSDSDSDSSSASGSDAEHSPGS